ncbi:hypothetical protein XENOCAPTIV_005758 [Xenoophorus captivus]|uniref:Uncharacterized protein n=1 Tax=Xenoophorus captivus TaxID=1517983 RepID=A0ABV0RUH2_9TELE
MHCATLELLANLYVLPVWSSLQIMHKKNRDELKKRPKSHLSSCLLASLIFQILTNQKKKKTKHTNTGIETSLVWQITVHPFKPFFHFHSLPLSQHVLCIA